MCPQSPQPKETSVALTLFVATLQALLPLFGLIAFGYVLKRGRVLHAAHAPVFNGLVVNATLPALVIHSLLHAAPIPRSSAWLPFLIIASEFAVGCVVFAAARAMRLSRAEQGAAILTGVFGNTGFLGYPITLALMPAVFTSAVLIDNFGMAIPLYCIAPIIGAVFGGSQGNSREMLLRIARSPVLTAAVLGILFRQIPISPEIAHNALLSDIGTAIDKCLTYLGQGTTPLVLLALGVSLQPGAVKKYAIPLILTNSAKLILEPLIVWPLCHLVGLPPEQTVLTVMIAAMPTSVMSSVLSGQYDLAGELAVATVFTTTLFSAIVIPLWLTLLR